MRGGLLGVRRKSCPSTLCRVSGQCNVHCHILQIALFRSCHTLYFSATMDGDEERPLLHDEEVRVQPTTPSKFSTWKTLASLSALVLLFVGGAAYFSARTSQQPTRDIARFSNGTHEFKRTVILISIDGLRRVIRCNHSGSRPNFVDSASYLDRGLTPHLLDISQQGLRAKYMQPIFPVSLFSYVLCYC